MGVATQKTRVRVAEARMLKVSLHEYGELSEDGVDVGVQVQKAAIFKDEGF